jgi:hypothetical protein
MSGLAGADLLVRGIRHCSACVSAGDALYAIEPLEDGFETPEAAPTEGDALG